MSRTRRLFSLSCEPLLASTAGLKEYLKGRRPWTEHALSQLLKPKSLRMVMVMMMVVVVVIVMVMAVTMVMMMMLMMMVMMMDNGRWMMDDGRWTVDGG